MDARERYFFGAHCYRVPSPPLEDVFADMASMKRLGLNLANLQISWSWLNPDEGVYDFSDFTALLDETVKLDLLVGLSLTPDQLPKWVWDKYPDCRLINARGEPHNDPTQYLMPADGKPGPNWDHPGVNAELERYIAALCEAVAPYENVIYWNVWQEITAGFGWPGATERERNTPFNEVSLERFRAWLEERYGTLENLNSAWGSRYHSFAAIEPPRIYPMVPPQIDWRRWVHEEYLGGIVRTRVALLRKYDTRKRLIAFHAGHPYYGSTCEFAWACEADYYGTSFYPTAAAYWAWEHPGGTLDSDEDAYHDLWTALFSLNYGRCAVPEGTAFAVFEMAAGPYNQGLELFGEVSAGDMRRWLSLQLAAGARSANLWNVRPEHFWHEAQGQGFLNGDGSMTERTEVIGTFAEAAAKHRELFARATKRPSSVALGLDENLYRFAEASRELRHVEMPLRGAYEALFRLGADPDFIDLERSEVDQLAEHDVIWLPFPFVLRNDIVAKLAGFVEAGGALICGPAPGRFDAHGWACPRWMPESIAALLGVRHESLRQVREFSEPPKWTTFERRAGDFLPPTRLSGAGIFEGLHPTAAFYVHAVTPLDSEATLFYGSQVVGTVCERGRGRVYFIGTVLPYATLGEECADAREVPERILLNENVALDRQGPLVRHVRRHGAREIWTLVNTGPGPTAWAVEGAWTTVTDVFSGERRTAGESLIVGRFDTRLLVGEG